MAAVTELCADIVTRYDIKPHRVLGHSDVAPHRKQDPGAHFNWRQLAEVGVGVWFEPDDDVKTDAEILCPALNEVEICKIQRKLSAIGYGLEVTGEFDDRTFFVITAFQRHYRPSKVDGRLDGQTIGLIDQFVKLIKA